MTPSMQFHLRLDTCEFSEHVMHDVTVREVTNNRKRMSAPGGVVPFCGDCRIETGAQNCTTTSEPQHAPCKGVSTMTTAWLTLCPVSRCDAPVDMLNTLMMPSVPL